jgi:hypothetical protein
MRPAAGAGAFLQQRETLIDAKAMLLVNDYQSQIREADVVLKERMRAHKKSGPGLADQGP